MVGSLASKLGTRDLTAQETLEALDDASALGVQGARIHDLLHARAAKLSGADLILTRDGGFPAIAEGIKVEWP
jgi:hypothetical protein